MDKINAVITGVGGYVPEDVLTNEDISKMVDTTDEWIMTRVGIKERRILKGEGVGLSYMGIRAVKQLLEKTNLNPEEVEVVLTATTTPDHHFPTTSSIIAYHTGCKNAMTFDMQGACAGRKSFIPQMVPSSEHRKESPEGIMRCIGLRRRIITTRRMMIIS